MKSEEKKEKKSKSLVSTRDKILDAALKLFNEKGEMSVTTAYIAETLGISEGNLWYHFRTKREIVAELNRRLEQEVDQNLSRTPNEKINLTDFMDYAERAFEYLWDYRFLFRDHSYGSHNEEAMLQLQKLTLRGQQNIERIIENMRRRKLLSLTKEEAKSLAVNAWIIHSNWLRFLQARENIKEITSAHIKEGFLQLFRLFSPYLNEEEKSKVEIFIEDFFIRRFTIDTKARDKSANL